MDANLFTIAQHVHIADIGHVIRPRRLVDAIETECVTSYFDGIANFHTYVFFGLITANQRYADNEHRYAQMCNMHAVIAA